MTSTTHPPGHAEPDCAFAESIPAVSDLFERIAHDLDLHGEAGLLSVTVLQHRSVAQSAGWRAYDETVAAIASILLSYRAKLRETDWFYEPAINGNTFVLLLGPPRSGRPMEPGDLSRVRFRIRRELSVRLARALPREVAEGFGCYVGGSLMRHDPRVRVERVVFRALEESLADALRDRERESRRQSLHLRRVVDRGLVSSVYQPVVDAHEQRVIGYEALTRVPRGRFESIDVLFKAAHANDAIWELERLCRRRALESLPRLHRDQVLFLNVEPDSIYDPDLRNREFAEQLCHAGIEPQRVVLEMTEHSAVGDFGSFRNAIDHVRERGFRLAMDDVGSGYAGLQAIAEIAPDFIKVDMTLIRDLHRHTMKRELISTMRRFTHSVGIQLVAEGVETVAELDSLLGLGVSCAQGFLFSRPGCPPSAPDWNDILRKP